jgi:N-acetyl-gamma-glutamyl-phosphate reductase
MNAPAKIPVGIIGGSGYIGAELLRYLSVHPLVDLRWVTANTRAGEEVAAVLPNLAGCVRLRFAKLEEVAGDLGGAKAVFVALPHNKSQEVIPDLATRHPGVAFIDMGGDFRTPDPAGYLKYYGSEHKAPGWLKRFVVGFTEFARPALRGAKLVANPGCFATTLVLGLAPLARAGKLRGEVSATGVTGSSGAGNVPSQTTHHPERAANFRAYKPLCHQHLLEVDGFLKTLTREPFRLDFVPQSGPFVRGIFTTLFPRGLGADVLEGIYRDAYGKEPLISIGRDSPELRWVQGTPRSHLGIAGDARQGVVFVVIDNLGKGAAGQAVQNFNCIFGIDETTGLMVPGGFV